MRALLVANRGEVACRVFRAAHARGLATVAVFTDVDAGSPHVAMADQAVRLGSADGYLDVARIIAAAARAGADAVHPGYGFLSERADFAQAVLAAGLTWVGPPPSAIAAMGDKAVAKALMTAAGVPCLPGSTGERLSDEALIAAAADVGFPLLVKAVAGGGGRGMRRVDDAPSLPAALVSARVEALSAFGDGALMLERLAVGCRHVEVQIVADAHGHVVHLGERECSIQRRHQKVIEEAPSPAVDAALRARMGATACVAARAVDYVGVGTVELLLSPDGTFWFLEMNTRLQVEHAVTEAVTGRDLVQLQLDIADGQPLPFAQRDVTLTGHAIEARLYAEDPSAGFLPQSGAVVAWSPGPGVRVDAAVGPSVPPDYDPMIAKLVAYGPRRAVAIRRLRRALDQTVLLGVATNRAFLGRVLSHRTFLAGDAHTGFVAATPSLCAPAPPPAEALAMAVAVFANVGDLGAAPWRGDVVLSGEAVSVHTCGDEVGVGEATFRVTRGPDWGEVDGVRRPLRVFGAPPEWVCFGPDAVRVRAWDLTPTRRDDLATDAVVALTTGTVQSLSAAVGDTVSAGDVVVVVEAMKIAAPHRVGRDGEVASVRVSVGDVVSAGDVLVVLTEVQT